MDQQVFLITFLFNGPHQTKYKLKCIHHGIILSKYVNTSCSAGSTATQLNTSPAWGISNNNIIIGKLNIIPTVRQGGTSLYASKFYLYSWVTGTVTWHRNFLHNLPQPVRLSSTVRSESYLWMRQNSLNWSPLYPYQEVADRSCEVFRVKIIFKTCSVKGQWVNVMIRDFKSFWVQHIVSYHSASDVCEPSNILT